MDLLSLRALRKSFTGSQHGIRTALFIAALVIVGVTLYAAR